jgi:hypothetical protein
MKPLFNARLNSRLVLSAREIESVIAKLQNNKAAGVDNITNEYIKFTLHIMLPIYTTILISLAILF